MRDNPYTPIQPVEPVLGLTREQQEKCTEDPEVTLQELLGLSSCTSYIQKLLQSLDRLYVNQSSRFLPLTTEAKRLAKKLEKEEQVSQWARISPLHCARDHLPQNIINILECLSKVDSTPFNKLYRLAQDCTDRYYSKAIQTLIELIKRNQTDSQVFLVNSAHALKYLETYVK